MPLVKCDLADAGRWEEMARRSADGSVDGLSGVSVWRWDAAAARWVELPCTALEWFLHDIAGAPLPGAPPDPLHVAVLSFHKALAGPWLARTSFAVLGEDGRKAEVVEVEPALRPRFDEIHAKVSRTPEESAEMHRIHDEAWAPFYPTAEMERRLLLDLGERFDISEVRHLLLR